MTSLPPLFHVASMSNGWFDSLPNQVQNDVLTRSRKRIVAPGERIFSRGDRPDGLYCVIEGSIRISGISEGGKEILLDFYGPGVWFGEVSMLDGLPRIHDAEAQEASSLHQLIASDLEELLAAHPSFSRALLRLEAHRLRLLLTAIEQYSTQTIEQRLANRLLLLAIAHGTETAKGLEIRLHLPQETLAQLIGSTRQRVNQILKEWELAGTVEQQYGRLTLLDRARLEQLAIL
jgi:CRP-like cAMP-binding protein